MAAPHMSAQQQGFPAHQGGFTGQPSMFNPGQAPTAPAPAPQVAPRQPGSGFGPPPAPAAKSPSGGGVGMHHRPAQGSMASGLFGGEGSSDVAAAAGQMAARAGLAQAQSLAAQYVPGAQALWLSLQVYFQVNNTFVIERLKTLLFPFRKRKWARHAKDGFEQEPEAPVLPVADPNAPDLYIPCMALVTFVLLTGVAHGTQTQFTPETLVNATSAALVTQLLELGALRLGLFLAAASPPPLLDLVALGGYKYVGIVLSTLAFLLLGSIGFYAALLYTSAAMAFFLVQTLQAAVPPGTAANPNRNYAILAAGGLQPLIMWWLASQ